MAKCFHCGTETPHGLRAPGRRSEIPPDMRDKYLPYCADHEVAAFARRDAKLGAKGASTAQPKPQRRGAVSGKTRDIEQGSLF